MFLISFHTKYFKGFVKHEILKSVVCSNPSAEGKELMAIIEAYLDDNYLTLCPRDRFKNLKEKMHFQQIRDYGPFMGEIMELESSFGIVSTNFILLSHTYSKTHFITSFY